MAAGSSTLPNKTETVTLRLPSGEEVDAIVPHGLGDDDVKSYVQMKRPDLFGPPAKAANAQVNVASSGTDKFLGALAPQPVERAGAGYKGGTVGVGEGANLAEALGAWTDQGPGNIVRGTVNAGSGNFAKGGHQILSGAGMTMLPAAPFAATASPAVFLRSLIAGSAIGYGAQQGAGALGANPEQAAFAGDIGGLVGGYAGAKAPGVISRSGPLAGLATEDLISRIPVLGRLVRRPSAQDYVKGLLEARKSPPKPVYPGAPFPEDPGVFPGAALPEKPSIDVLRARVLQAGGRSEGPDPSSVLGTIKAKPVYPGAPYPEHPGTFPGAPYPEKPAVYPGAPLPANPGSFPGAPFPERPSADALKAAALQYGPKKVMSPSDALSKIKAYAATPEPPALPVKLQIPRTSAKVPYSGPRTPAMEPALSNTIAQHGYHGESNTMVVEFKNGKVYEYRGVPPEIYDAYQKSESQGSFFAQNIKGRYQTNYRGTAAKK